MTKKDPTDSKDELDKIDGKQFAKDISNKGLKKLFKVVGKEEENFHSTCSSCKKLIPNEHFDCHRSIEKVAVQRFIEEFDKRYEQEKEKFAQCRCAEGVECTVWKLFNRIIKDNFHPSEE